MLKRLFLIAALALAPLAARADGTIDSLTSGGALAGTELLPMFQTANPAVTTTPSAISTYVNANLPTASSSVFGIAECDNSTITCPGGVFSAVSGGSGNVVSPGSGFTAGHLIEANNSAGTAILDAGLVATNVITSTATQTSNAFPFGGGSKTLGGVIGPPVSGLGVLAGWSTGNTPAQIVLGTNLSMTGSTLNATGGGSSAFSALTSSTNTTMAGVIGSGASITLSGSGVNVANQVPAALGTGTVCSTAGPLSVSAGCPIVPTAISTSTVALVAANAGQLVLATNASPTTMTLAQSTGSLGTGFGLDAFTDPSTSTLNVTTSTLNGLSSIKLGAYQDIAIAAIPGGNYVGAISVPQPPTQTHTTCLFDDFVWSACSGSGTLTASGSITNGSLGIWASGTSLSGTVLPGTGVLTFLATPSSANLAAAVTGETGTGALVFGTSPGFTGTPTAPTATVGTNTTQLATTAFVLANAAGTPVIFVGAGAGTANAQTVATTTPSGFTLTNQFVVRFSAGATNTAATNLNVDSTGLTPVEKQLSSGFAALSGGEIVSGLEYDATYNSTCTCFVLTNTPGSAIVNNATSATVTAVQWANGTLFNVTSAAQTITLPVATTLASNGNIFINAIGNSVTLQPNAADGVNGGSIGSSVTVASGVFAVVSTVGSSGTGAITANPLTGGSGSGTVNAGTSTHLAYYASSTNAVSSNTHLTETGTKSGIDYNTAALPTALTGTVLQAASADTVATRFEADAFGAQAFYTGACFGGTNASPTAITAGTQCGGYNSWLYNGSALVGPLASLRTFANELQASAGTHGGTYLDITATPLGSQTAVSQMQIVPSAGGSGGGGGAGVNFALGTSHTPFALTDAAPIAVDASKGSVFSVTPSVSRTLGFPTNLPTTNQQTLIFEVTQPAGGGVVLTLGSGYTGTIFLNPKPNAVTTFQCTSTSSSTAQCVGGFNAVLPSFTIGAGANQIPACSATYAGWRVYVTDGAAIPVYNTTQSGGGSTPVPVFCDGTNWTNH